jgi:demethylmenaquinone methyltransferase/2-methoxy-6-polyprenyl-1,4-benzoquinol methylase
MTKREGKKQEVRAMFNSIANRYDFLNHFLSAGIDYRWRKKAIKLVGAHHPKIILDVATGTGDLAIAASVLNPFKIIGIDIAENMLAIGRNKIAEKNLQDLITFETGDCENLHFNDGTFDAVMVAFGVRNFENLEKGLSEMFRVLNNKGIAVILEFSKPTRFGIKQLYSFYFRYILPFLGRKISGNSSAYNYLPDSVGEFPAGGQFLNILEKAGFRQTSYTQLSFGIASIYTGIKTQNDGTN